MATYEPQVATVQGDELVFHAADSGDQVSGVDKPTRMIVNNAGMSSVTLTITPPGKTEYGVDLPDKVWTIPAETVYSLLLLPSFRDPDDDWLVSLTWSATSDVTFAVVG